MSAIAFRFSDPTPQSSVQPGDSWFELPGRNGFHTFGILRSRTMCDARMHYDLVLRCYPKANMGERTICTSCETRLHALQQGELSLPRRDSWPCDLSSYLKLRIQKLGMKSETDLGSEWFMIGDKPQRSLHTAGLDSRRAACGARLKFGTRGHRSLDEVSANAMDYSCCGRCLRFLETWGVLELVGPPRPRRAELTKNVRPLRSSIPTPTPSSKVAKGIDIEKANETKTESPAPVVVDQTAPATAPARRTIAAPVVTSEQRDRAPAQSAAPRPPLGSTKVVARTTKRPATSQHPESVHSKVFHTDLLSARRQTVRTAAQQKALKDAIALPIGAVTGGSFHELLFSNTSETACGLEFQPEFRFASEADASANGFAPCTECFAAELESDRDFERRFEADETIADDGFVDLY